MIYLILSIASSTCVLIIFRKMKDHGANISHTIMISYFISTLCGLGFFSSGVSDFSSVWAEPWFWPAAIEGIGFYLVFISIAKATQKNGVAVASIAGKMSVVIPIAMGVLLLNESITGFKMLGVFAGILAVLLSVSGTLGVKDMKWPLLVFIGSGVIDASLKIFEQWLRSPEQFPMLITIIFVFALLSALSHHIVSGQGKVEMVSVLSGLVLGVANFGTVYFLLQALALPKWESSVIYAVNNFGVVIFSILVGMVFFREKPGLRGWFGFALAIASIGMIFRGAFV